LKEKLKEANNFKLIIKIQQYLDFSISQSEISLNKNYWEFGAVYHIEGIFTTTLGWMRKISFIRKISTKTN
jgi:hypothetical protein